MRLPTISLEHLFIFESPYNGLADILLFNAMNIVFHKDNVTSFLRRKTLFISQDSIVMNLATSDNKSLFKSLPIKPF